VERFDVVIVGARVGGATLASLLGRRGVRVLLIDKADFPSDTLSTHLIYGDSFGVWQEIGAWRDILRVGAVPLVGIDWQRLGRNASLFGHFIPVNGHAYALCLRRLLLDQILVDNARATPGVTVWTRTSVSEVLQKGDRAVGVRYEHRGRAGTETGRAFADLVVGADGRFSLVSKCVGSPEYNVVPPLYFPFYAYLRDVQPIDPPVLEIVESTEAQATIMLAPCDDGIWMAIIYTEQRQFDEFRRDHTRLFWERLRADSRLSDRLARARRITPVRGRGDLVNFMRVAAGPGWALVGDSGHHTDPIYGQGIGDAVRTARLLCDLVVGAVGGDQPWVSALAEFHTYRDLDLVPNYDWMIKGCPRGWNRHEFEEFMAFVGLDADLSTRFVNIFSHGVSSAEFFGAPTLEYWREQRRKLHRVPAKGGS
jgi:menaquinone-9 beta-reductase